MNYEVTISDDFWNRYRGLVKHRMIPYQWDVLNDAADITIEKERDDASIPNEKSHAIENFKIAAKRAQGEHYGWVFQDSDVYKWLEAAAYTLCYEWDAKLKETADEVVDLISAAQEEDGYLNTYFSIMEPGRRYKRLGESHELYCAGHFLEAAVAYHQAAGSDKVLETAVKLADHICSTFGEGNGQIRGVDGHEEIEIGLMRLYHLTGNEKYMDTASFFLRERGKDPGFFMRQNREDGGRPLIAGLDRFPLKYYQMHRPVLEQDTAEGHAVRLVYLSTALADLAAETGNEELAGTCRKIWRNIVDKRMYITGGIGSTVHGESFTLDHDLPNDTMYCETCASVGLIFFARQMLMIEASSEYADVMERALYNTVLAGAALDGRHFFYVNPLEAVPDKSAKDPGKSHVKTVRPQWLGCACCPPNLARLIASLDKYIYTVRKDEILVNLFIGSELKLRDAGKDIVIRQECRYPRSGTILFYVTNKGGDVLDLKIRIASWSTVHTGAVDNVEAEICAQKGYWKIGVPAGEHTIAFNMDIDPKRWYSDPRVSENIGKAAIARGPFVYCAESIDNGKDLHCLLLPKNAELDHEWREELLEGVGIIKARGKRLIDADSSGALYRGSKDLRTEECEITMIPYYAWANRGENEMRVWLNETEGEGKP
ncbi:MAG: glycoside hydrolase family 127 protein [Lachnospiraceae bacterium]|nr:glycoside hydrolase family 127 protein [Lachnospiraceae bacterium]